MNAALTVGLIFLQTAWQVVCRSLCNQRRWLSPPRYGSLRSAFTAILLAPLVALTAAETKTPALASVRVLDVAEFGAVPNDGKDDTLAIEAAIQAARRSQPTEIHFAAGTYNLIRTVSGKTSGTDYYIGVKDAENLAFVGATNGAGKPATRLERNLVLNNDAMPPNQICIQHSSNITFRKVRFEPENGNLAIGGRDGLHLSMNSGRLLIEDCYFKGLRMDPLVIRRSFGLVKEIRADGSLLISPGYAVPSGDRIRFWVGADPVDAVVAKSERQKGGYAYRFADGAPAGAKIGTAVSYQTYSLNQALIRNTIFADNFGSAIVNFEENVTVEGCTFDNNAYQVKYGPNVESGGFVRNNIIRNNVFLNTSWVDIAHRGQPADIVIHSLSKFFKAPRYNRNILIAGNVFKNPHGDTEAVGIDVRNAEDVQIRDNTFEGYTKPVMIDGNVRP